MQKLERGQKKCPKCKKVNASRQRVCKHCSFEFISKNIPVKSEVKNWKELEIGSYIKIIQGTGPYFIAKRENDECKVGERICMGDTGVFKVIKIDKNGIVAFGATNKNAGYTYLYMGKAKYSEITGIFSEPYRIKKVKQKIRV